MVQAAGGLGFPDQAVRQRGAGFGAALKWNCFQCDSAANEFVVRLVDNTHRAAAQFGLDLVTAGGSLKSLQTNAGLRIRLQRSHSLAS